jgi:hypothetical protein
MIGLTLLVYSMLVVKLLNFFCLFYFGFVCLFFYFYLFILLIKYRDNFTFTILFVLLFKVPVFL